MMKLIALITLFMTHSAFANFFGDLADKVQVDTCSQKEFDSCTGPARKNEAKAQEILSSPMSVELYRDSENLMTYLKECGCWRSNTFIGFIKKNETKIREKMNGFEGKVEAPVEVVDTIKEDTCSQEEFDRCAGPARANEAKTQEILDNPMTVERYRDSEKLLTYVKECSCWRTNTFIGFIKKNEANIREKMSSSGGLMKFAEACTKYDSCSEKNKNMEFYRHSIFGFLFYKENTSPTTLWQYHQSERISHEDVVEAQDFVNECGCWMEINSKYPSLTNDLKQFHLDKAKSVQETKAAQMKQDKQDAIQASLDKQKAIDDKNAEKVRAVKQNSKECKIAMAKSEYCTSLANAKIGDLTIAREKKIGQVSGYVNAVTLRNAAEIKLTYEDHAERSKQNYIALGGKTNLNPAICKLQSNGHVAESTAGFYEEAAKACGE